eukprot:3270232-Amphidinium_carterae.1
MDHHPVLCGGRNAATLEEQSLALHMILARCTSSSTVQVASTTKLSTECVPTWRTMSLNTSSAFSSISHSVTCRCLTPTLKPTK